MQLTHLGHAAVLVEVADRRILIDPGNFSSAWHQLSDLDAVLVTHQHPDHCDPAHLPALLERNPQAQVWVEPDTLTAVPLPGAQAMAVDGVVELGGLVVRGVGGVHAEIHRDIPAIGNIGLVFEAEGEPRFFHPGDSLAAVPAGIDVVAIPGYGPWAAMKETIDFARAVAAPQGFLIHEGLLAEPGFALVHGRVGAMSPTTLHDLRGGGVWSSETAQ